MRITWGSDIKASHNFTFAWCFPLQDALIISASNQKINNYLNLFRINKARQLQQSNHLGFLAFLRSLVPNQRFHHSTDH